MTSSSGGAGTRDRAAAPVARPVLIYDGECAMCRKWAERVRRWDRRGAIELLPSQPPSTAARFPWIPRERLDEAMHLVDPDGTTRVGAAAAEAVLRLLPAGRWLNWIFSLPGVRSVADRVYRAVAVRRCRDACARHGRRNA